MGVLSFNMYSQTQMTLGMTAEPNIITKSAPKERKKHDRFNGMSEEEVSKRTLPDHLANNLDIIIVSVIFRLLLLLLISLVKEYENREVGYSENKYTHTCIH